MSHTAAVRRVRNRPAAVVLAVVCVAQFMVGARRQHRKRRPAEHPPRPASEPERARVGAQCLHPDLRRLPAAWWSGRGLVWPATPCPLGLALFTVASLLGGLAQTGGELIAARAAQGLGGAVLSPATLTILTTTFLERKAPR